MLVIWEYLLCPAKTDKNVVPNTFNLLGALGLLKIIGHLSTQSLYTPLVFKNSIKLVILPFDIYPSEFSNGYEYIISFSWL